jgi:hypothetical protein
LLHFPWEELVNDRSQQKRYSLLFREHLADLDYIANLKLAGL